MGYLRIDGAIGEGGGQVLRSSLSLAAILKRNIEIDNIRKGRSRPGLQRQHLTSVLAAAEVCGAEVEGVELGSTRIFFRPGKVKGGTYTFDIGTAGSTTLVLQTLIPVLLYASEPSVVIVKGGTHNSMAPPYHYLKDSFIPILQKIGIDIQVELINAGFYPAGGGSVKMTIVPPSSVSPIFLTRDTCSSITSIKFSVVSTPQVPDFVSKIQYDTVSKMLHTINSSKGYPASLAPLGRNDVERIQVQAKGNGNLVQGIIQRNCDILKKGVCSFLFSNVVTSFSERDIKASVVASKAVEDIVSFLPTGMPVDEHLSDQLLLPLALLGGGEFEMVPTTSSNQHFTTNLEIIHIFLGDCIVVQHLDPNDNIGSRVIVTSVRENLLSRSQ